MYRIYWKKVITPVVILAVGACMLHTKPLGRAPSFDAQVLVVPPDCGPKTKRAWYLSGLKDLQNVGVTIAIS